jgi:hypothetical protein
VFALEQLRRTAGILDDLDAALQFAQSVIADLAVLAGDRIDDTVSMFLEQRLEGEQDARA